MKIETPKDENNSLAFVKLANQRMQVYFFLSDMKIGTGISLGDTHALACLHSSSFFFSFSLSLSLFLFSLLVSYPSLCSDEHVTSVHFRLRFYPSVVTCDSRGVQCGGQEGRSWASRPNGDRCSSRWEVRQFRQKSR